VNAASNPEKTGPSLAPRMSYPFWQGESMNLKAFFFEAESFGWNKASQIIKKKSI